MGDVLVIATTGLVSLFSFVVGTIIGQKIQNNEKIEIPRIEPIKAIRESIQERKEEKEIKKEEEKLNIIMQNIENYNGDSTGQKEVI